MGLVCQNSSYNLYSRRQHVINGVDYASRPPNANAAAPGRDRTGRSEQEGQYGGAARQGQYGLTIAARPVASGAAVDGKYLGAAVHQ